MTGTKEKWVKIDNHHEYLVSNKGRVFSLKTRRFLKQRDNSMGYLRVRIDKKQMFVHRLVATAFVPGCGTFVNHLDFNPHNNASCNLEWTDRAGNMKYSADRGRFKHDNKWIIRIRSSVIRGVGKPVRSVSEAGEVTEYECVNAVVRDGHQPSCVSLCCNGKQAKHHGLCWEFL